MAAESERFVLGLDAGNTVIKAVLFDLEGRKVSACAIYGESATPEPGHVERALLANVMERANGNQTQAADILGVNRNTLRAKLTKYKLL